MSRDIRILSRARTDVNHIYSWLETRSPRGAAAWYQAFWVTASKLGSAAESCPLAPEAELLQRQLREAVFKTRRGRRYHCL
jgi:plasmid stabilization system protein ParE